MDCLAVERGGHFPESESSTVLFDSLKACGKQKDLHKGSRIHAGLVKRGLIPPGLPVGTALICMYAKCGALEKSRKLFDDLPAWDTVAWNALITGYAQRGLAHDALNCFECMQSKGFSPDAVTYVCILKACSSLGAIDKGIIIHEEVDKQGLLKKHVVLGSSLLHMYCKCGALRRAEELFSVLPVRNVVSWNVLITGYLQQGLKEKALDCYLRMQEEDISPNEITFCSVLKACAGLQSIGRGEEIHKDVAKCVSFSDNNVIGTALIDMYAKCGALAKARNVFDELVAPDVASWTALISGCVQTGLGMEALTLYEQMRKKGLRPNEKTYVCVIKACSNLKELEKGKNIHTEIGRHESIKMNIKVTTALVDMYAKCGALAKAQELFDEIAVRDVAAWNALIGGYAQQSHGEEALRCYKEMQDEGLPPNSITFINVLNACVSIGAVQTGEEIHQAVSQQDLLRENVILGNALVDMYAKCGKLQKAQEVFEQLPACDTASWNTLLTGYIQHGYAEEALKCFEQMRSKGFSPDGITFVCILKACGSIKAVEKGEEIHDEVCRQGIMQNDSTVGTALVEMYVKCGLLSKALRIFKQLSTHDVTSWNALILGYAQNGEGQMALNLLGQMQDEVIVPNAVTFVGGCMACSSIRNYEKGVEIHAEVCRRGLLDGNIFLGNALVDMYAKCEVIVKARDVFEELPIRDVISWNAMIGGLASNGLGEEAWAYFERMCDEGPDPDIVTYVSVLQACGTTRALAKGEIIHDEVCRNGLLKDNKVLGSAMVDMYAKCGALAKAYDVLKDISAPDATCWNALMVGYVNHELSDEVLSFAAQMEEEGIVRDSATFMCILKACGSLGAIKLGKYIHMEVERKGLLENNLMLGNALVDMYAKCGALKKSQEVFDKLSTRDVVSWTTLSAGYAQLGNVDVVLHVFSEMINNHINPNEVTFFVLLSACSHAGLVEQGQILFETMCSTYSILPSLEHHICLVDLYSRVRQFNMALSVVNMIQPSRSILPWLVLLGACHTQGNIKLGGEAFQRAFQLDDGYASAYVCMSNLYSTPYLLQDGYSHKDLENYLIHDKNFIQVNE